MDVTKYPFLNVMWTFFLIFIWIAWFFLLIRIVMDVFRRHDLGGFMKAIWLIVLVFVPFLGVLVYLIAEGGKMSQREAGMMKEQQAQQEAYIRRTAGSGGSAAEIEKAKALLDAGTINQAEYEKLKANALAS